MATDGLNQKHFREAIIRPVLGYLGLYSKSAENLLLGTALQESRLHYLRQLNYGPALGVYQIEPRTYHDLYKHWLADKDELRDKVTALRSVMWVGIDSAQELIGNLYYTTGIARLLYRRVPEGLPHHSDAGGMAHYWKRYWNTALGKGTVEEATKWFSLSCQD